MPNQYTSLTAENIRRKINRRRNPVTSVLQLAREFGYATDYTRYDDARGRARGSRAPESFVKQVKALIGEREFDRLRQSKYVNTIYR